jgi:uncharacterized protein YbjT (DUF2867 family)
MSMRIAVAGGTGTVGRHVMSELAAAGHTAVALSRSAGVDLMDPASVSRALAGADAVIDVASVKTLSAKRSAAFFGATTTNLLDAEAAQGVGHHVALSIIGAAAAPYNYYAGKKVQEELITPGRNWSILRAAQFHEFAPQTAAQAAFAGFTMAPKGRTQPIAAAEVAAELVRIAAGGPQGFARDLAGPQEEWLPDMIRRYLGATGTTPRVIEFPLPGGLGKAMRQGVLLPGPGAQLGTQTFAEWIASL